MRSEPTHLLTINLPIMGQHTMRPADRLFQIIQILRGSNYPITAKALAEELEVSVRTVYRDVADLIGQRVPIQGEAGIGYVLRDGYDMPPLMLTADEVEAAVLGAQWVAVRGDPALKRGARDLIAKLIAVMPKDLKSVALEAAVISPPSNYQKTDAMDLTLVRTAIRGHQKLKISYRDEQDRSTTRTIWPIAIVYFDSVRLLAGYCELREDFRHFRTDRLCSLEVTQQRIPEPTSILRRRWTTVQQACGRTEVPQSKP